MVPPSYCKLCFLLWILIISLFLTCFCISSSVNPFLNFDQEISLLEKQVELSLLRLVYSHWILNPQKGRFLKLILFRLYHTWNSLFLNCHRLVAFSFCIFSPKVEDYLVIFKLRVLYIAGRWTRKWSTEMERTVRRCSGEIRMPD